MGIERLVGGRLIGEDVETRRANLAAFQPLEQGGLVHVGAAGGVDDHNAVLHLLDGLLVDQSTAVHSGGVNRDEVGARQELVLFHIGDAQLLFNAGNMIDIEGDDVHADGLGHDAEALADAAVAKHTEGLALELDALAVGLLFPLVLAHGVTGVGDEPGAGEQVSHGQLRNGLGGGARGVLDVDAVFLGIVHVDVVEADAAADDALQLAALGLIDLLLADLGLGADDDNVEVAHGLAAAVDGPAVRGVVHGAVLALNYEAFWGQFLLLYARTSFAVYAFFCLFQKSDDSYTTGFGFSKLDRRFNLWQH